MSACLKLFFIAILSASETGDQDSSFPGAAHSAAHSGMMCRWMRNRSTVSRTS